MTPPQVTQGSQPKAPPQDQRAKSPVVEASPHNSEQIATQAHTEAQAEAATAPSQVSPEGSRRPQSTKPSSSPDPQPKTTRFKEDVLAVTIPIALTPPWHRVTASISLTNFLPFERQAFVEPHLDPRLKGGNSLMKDHINISSVVNSIL